MPVTAASLANLKRTGRKPGTKNRASTDVAAALRMLAEQNIDKCQQWLDATAAVDPAKALSLFLTMLEYVKPKLGRIEQEVNGEVRVSINVVNFADIHTQQVATAPISDARLVQIGTGDSASSLCVAPAEREG
jgi:hypothetical protein